MADRTLRAMATDGAKSVQINDSWDFVEVFAAQPYGEQSNLYARVSAAFQALNKTARAVSGIPFALVNKAGEDYDISGTWENKVGYLPSPKDLIRRITMSLMMSNAAYLRHGQNAAGRTKALHYVIQPSIKIITDPATGELVRLDREANGRVLQSYAPDDPALIRFWWLDHETELIPTANTEFRAMMSAAGVIYYSDYFTENFYRRGGIKPTLVAMKGLIMRDKQEEEQKSWTEWVRGIGRWFSTSVRIFNAEAMDVKPFGEGLGDLKETPVYRQALENIAIATGMPISILLSNAANYATAQVDYWQWFRDDLTPRCEFIAETLNDQLFARDGLRMEFRPEMTDPGQQDEADRAQALSIFMDFLTKSPSAEIALESALTFGYELTPGLIDAINAHFAEKEKQPPPSVPPTPPAQPEQQPAPEQPPAPAKSVWVPSVDELEELRVWREVTLKRLKRGEALDFEYHPHYGGLPGDVIDHIRVALPACKSADEVKALFEYRPVVAEQDGVAQAAALHLEGLKRAIEFAAAQA